MALLNIVASYYETGLTHSAALGQMHLLSLTLAGRSAKDLTEFVRKTNYILHGLKQSDRPAPETLSQSGAVATGEASAHPFANHGQGSRVWPVEEEDL